ncbi:DUF4097 family beta strand repeat-containing protein [Rapidithrix thailandica]|uniref:DUF4097 family beta strand repeat-containing protein n=1 Tax=Rapidithrix thailandica TaxID=413964 RepID=A0AAW9SCG5_9BACT
MKHSNLLFLLLFWVTLLAHLSAYSQEKREESDWTYVDHEFPENSTIKWVQIENLFGSVEVTAYEGKKVRVDIEKRVRFSNWDQYDSAQVTVELVTRKTTDSLIFYVDAPFLQKQFWYGRINYQVQSLPGDYKVTFHFHIELPHGVQLVASTLGEGDVQVKGLNAQEIHLNNVNGNIQFEGVSGKTTAQTVQGNITGSFSKNPFGKSYFKTTKGNIQLSFQENLSAYFNFIADKGTLTSEFEFASAGREASKDIISKNGHVTYQLKKREKIKVGKGGFEYQVETGEGNIILKKGKLKK